MTPPRELRDELVRDLLRDKWDSSNTYSLTPNITFGGYDQKAEGTPLLGIDDFDEGPTGGGRTGYDSLDTTQGGPEQTKAGNVDCHIFTHSDDLDSATTDNESQYGQAVTDEIDRIARNNAVRPTNPNTNNQPVREIAPGQARDVPERDEHLLHHRVIPVNYVYHTND